MNEARVQNASPYVNPYRFQPKSGKLRMIFNDMKETVRYDFVFKRWLIDDEHDLNWLYGRIVKCYFIDEVCWFDSKITYDDFVRGGFRRRLTEYIAERRATERRRAGVSA